MKELLILRHAKAQVAVLRQSDHARPLQQKGRRQSDAVGEWLVGEGLLPGLIITSDAARTVETAVRAANAADYDGEIRQTRELYLAAAESYLALLADLDDALQRVMVVGHNPGMEELAEFLARRPVEMKTAAIVQVQLEIERWD